MKEDSSHLSQIRNNNYDTRFIYFNIFITQIFSWPLFDLVRKNTNQSLQMFVLPFDLELLQSKYILKKVNQI